MPDHTNWSLPLGNWAGVRVRMHMVLLLFIACTLYLGWCYQEAGSKSVGIWMASESLLVLIASVIVHELGHSWVAARMGGATKAIVLTPWGGAGAYRTLPDRRAELLVQLAGPAANLIVCLACLPLFLLYSEPVLGLIPPLMPHDLTGEWSTVAFSRLIFWVNWLLLFVNLTPMYPFDGGQALWLALVLRWPRLEQRGASMITSSLAKVIAAGIFAAAMLIKFDDMVGSPTPTRFALIVLSILFFFSARQQEKYGTVAGDDSRPESEDSTATGTGATNLAELERDLENLGDPLAGPLGQWLESRRESRQERQLQQHLEEDDQLDEILQRIHDHGVQSLTEHERELLERVSTRYRSQTDSQA